MTRTTNPPAVQSSPFLLGGDLPVRRLGFGTMQLTGPGHWEHPAGMDQAMAVLRRAVDLGVNHLDTADAYGPQVVEHLIRKALHPYPDGLVIATKGGLTRQGPNKWAPVGRPEYLRQSVEMSLRRLALDRIDLYYLHRIDPDVPYADQLGVLADLQREGKIHHLGLSKVTDTVPASSASPTTMWTTTPGRKTGMPERHALLLAWDPKGEPLTVGTPDETETQLRELHTRLSAAGTPTLVVVERDGEQTSLAVGVGGASAMASWLGDDPTDDLVSHGDGNDDEELVAFLYAGAESEYPASVSIDLEDALAAARQYAATGQRPTNLNWQSI